MLEINNGYNILKIDISNYINKKYREINKMDEDDCWCNLYIMIQNEYMKLENSYYSLECIEVDRLYEMLNNFNQDKLENNCSFEPIEPSFKMYFYPYGEEYNNNNYLQYDLSRNDKIVRLFIAFIEKETKAPSSDGIIIDLYFEAVKKIQDYLEKELYK